MNTTLHKSSSSLNLETKPDLVTLWNRWKIKINYEGIRRKRTEA